MDGNNEHTAAQAGFGDTRHRRFGVFVVPGEVREGVAVDDVVAGAKGKAHAVFAALDEVVGEEDVERLQGGETGVLSSARGG